MVAGVSHPDATAVAVEQVGEHAPAPARRWGIDLAIAAAFTAVAGVTAARHALWRDEVQAWAIAATSHSPGDLLEALRHEGHPPLWYLVLTPLSRVTSQPRAMLVLTVACFAVTVLVLLRTAPWSRLVSVVLLAGYFPLFEFTVIARSYSLGMLLTFALCAVGWPRSGLRRWPLFAVLATLLALTSLANSCIGGAIVLGALVDEVVRRDGVQWQRLRAPRVWVSMAGAAVTVAVGGYLVRPAADIVIPTRDGNPNPITRAVGQVARSLIPIPNVQRSWWGSSWFVLNLGDWPTGVLGIVILLVVLWTLRRSIAAVVLLVTGAGLILILGATTSQVALHVSGNLVLGIAAATWCYRRAAVWAADGAPGDLGSRPVAQRRTQMRAFAVVLALQLAGTVVVLPLSWTDTFSGLQEASASLRQWPRLPVVAEPEATAGGLAGMLDRPVFVPSSGLEQWYTIWDHVGSSDGLPPPDDVTVARARRFARGRAVALVLDHPIQVRDPGILPLFTADGVVVPSENYFGYLVLPTPVDR